MNANTVFNFLKFEVQPHVKSFNSACGSWNWRTAKLKTPMYSKELGADLNSSAYLPTLAGAASGEINRDIQPKAYNQQEFNPILHKQHSEYIRINYPLCIYIYCKAKFIFFPIYIKFDANK